MQHSDGSVMVRHRSRDNMAAIWNSLADNCVQVYRADAQSSRYVLLAAYCLALNIHIRL